MTDTILCNVLEQNCSSVTDLKNIADILQLTSYMHDLNSFKMSYKSLATALQREYNVCFAMVEGLHRMFVVRNVLEGRLTVDSNSDPSVNNIFLETKVKIRVKILDQFDENAVQQMQELSLFTMQVKKASLDRTVYDEISQIANEIKFKNKIVDFTKNRVCFTQPARNDKARNIFLSQREFIYNFICTFALNGKRSTVLYNYQKKHIRQVASSQHIPDKHAYLGVDRTTDLNDDKIFTTVSKIVASNLQLKAQDFCTLCTKEFGKTNDKLLKPICQELRIVLSYILLASLSPEAIQEATKVLSTNYRFSDSQACGLNVNVLDTMFYIVDSIHRVIDCYKKELQISSNDIHSTKLQQLLQMNLFQDVIATVKNIGHHPLLNITLTEAQFNAEEMESDLIRLLKLWNNMVTTYLSTVCRDELIEWKENLFMVAKGGNNNYKKSDLRSGNFACKSFHSYSVEEIVKFSTFVKQVKSNSLQVYIVEKKEISIEKEDDSDLQENNETIINSIDDESYATEINIPSQSSDQVLQKRKSSDDETVMNAKKKKSRNASNKKVNKKTFDIPDEVFTIYEGAISKEEHNIPFDRDMKMIREAWMVTIEKCKTPSDLKRVWEMHKELLYNQLKTNNTA